MNTQTLELDLSKDGLGGNVVCVGQGDNGGTTINAYIYDNGAEANLSGYSGYLEVLLPSKRHYYRATCSVSGSVAIVTVDESKLCAVAGYTDEAYFTFEKSGVKYSTERFAIDIKRSALDGQKPAESWDNKIEDLIDSVETQKNDQKIEFDAAQSSRQTSYEQAEQTRRSTFAANETTRQAAESTRLSSETARVDAETKRAANESTRITSETARASAESSRVTVESGRASAESARVSNEAGRVNAETARGTTENARATAEGTRKSNETARQTAERARVAAETQRETNQAKNNADQAINNAAMAKLTPYICGAGEYNATTLMPTITGEPNRLYFVPDSLGPGNRYVEWMLIESAWEMMGVSKIELSSVTTDEVDAVASGAAPSGESVLSLTGLSYLWAKLRDRFAAARHRHDCSDLDGVLLAGGSAAARNVLEIRTTPDKTSQVSIRTKIPYSANNMCSVRIRGTANYLVVDITVTWYNYTDGGTVYSPRVAFAGDALPLGAYVSTYDDAGTERISITIVGDSPGALRFGGFAVDCFIYNKAAPRAYFEGWACSTSTAVSPAIAPAGRIAKCAVASSVGMRQVAPPMLDRAYLSLDQKSQIAKSSDLNAITKPGTYVCSWNSAAATLVNSPTGAVSFTLVVDAVLGNDVPKLYVRQRIDAYDSAKSYARRTLDGGKTWSEWVQTSVAEAPKFADMGANGYAVKCAGHVSLLFRGSVTASPWTTTRLFALPADFRPPRYWEGAAMHHSGVALVGVSTNGDVNINPFGAALAAARIYGGMTYPLERN